MTSVYLYGGSGKYIGGESFTWHSPKVGNTHKFILFLSQQVNEPQQQSALAELEEFGFVELHINVGKPIAVEVLNESAMQAFQKYYESALSEGCALVWYP